MKKLILLAILMFSANLISAQHEEKKYLDDGIKWQIGQYNSNGYPNGEFRVYKLKKAYGDIDYLIEKENYKNGIRVNSQYYNSNGDITQSYKYASNGDFLGATQSDYGNIFSSGELKSTSYFDANEELVGKDEFKNNGKLSTSTKYKNGNKSEEKTYNEDGKLSSFFEYKNDEPFQCTLYYEDGEPSNVTEFDGSFYKPTSKTLFYPNGVISSKISLATRKIKLVFKGKELGTDQFNLETYHENGVLSENGLLITQVNDSEKAIHFLVTPNSYLQFKIGVWKQYYTNKKLYTITPYSFGEIDGEVKYYHDNGTHFRSILYEIGTPIEAKSAFDRSGNNLDAGTLKYGTGSLLLYDLKTMNVISEKYYKKNKKVGLWKEYYPNGDKKSIESYVDNEPTEAEHFYPNGKVEGRFKKVGNSTFIQENYYKNGQLQEKGKKNNENSEIGEWNYYYENGQLAQTRAYDNGKMINMLSYFDEAGKKLAIGTLKNGNGTLNLYEDGKLMQKLTFKDGYPKEDGK